MGNEGSHSIYYGQTIDNDITCKWKKACSNQFVAREGHCSASVENCLFVFGGVTLVEQEGIESAQLFCFNQEKSEWNVIQGTGDVPCPRSAATMCAVGKSLFLFGGLSRESGWFNDIYKFDTESSIWTRLSPEGTAPSPRDKMASTTIGPLVYIFGGFGPQNSGAEPVVEEDEEDEYEDDSDEEQEGVDFGWFNDLFIFNTETCQWSNPMQMNLGVPSPRAATAMCAVNKHLLIFGGRDSQARRNDLHIFNTETRKWVTDLDKVVAGRQPEPRSFHTMTTVGDRVVVLGGRGQANEHFNDFHIFDTNTRQWLQPTIEGDLPCGRGLHTTTVLGDCFILYGGSSDFNSETMQCQTFHGDAYYVNTDEILSGSSSIPQDLPANTSHLSGSNISTKSTSNTQEAAQTSSERSLITESPGTGDHVPTELDDGSPAKKLKTENIVP